MDYREMMKQLEDKSFVRHFPYFPHHTIQHGGVLPDEPAAHAAWYYCKCAIGMFREIHEGAQYEGELDHINMLNNLVRSVSALYNLNSPDDLLRMMPHCRLEAIRLELGWDDRIEKPFYIGYIK